MPFIPRHACPLPKLVSTADKVMGSGDTFTCPMCNRVWFVAWGTPYGGLIQPQWLCTTPPDAPSLAQRLNALNALTVQPRQAQAVMVALAANATTTLTATWDTAFPDASYKADVIVPVALADKANAVVTAQTPTAVTLTITTTQAAAAGPVFNVIGTRLE